MRATGLGQTPSMHPCAWFISARCPCGSFWRVGQLRRGFHSTGSLVSAGVPIQQGGAGSKHTLAEGLRAAAMATCFTSSLAVDDDARALDCTSREEATRRSRFAERAADCQRASSATSKRVTKRA